MSAPVDYFSESLATALNLQIIGESFPRLPKLCFTLAAIQLSLSHAAEKGHLYDISEPSPDISHV